VIVRRKFVKNLRTARRGQIEQAAYLRVRHARYQPFCNGCRMAWPSHYVRRMNSERIDFISAYCDRWCERCAFTARCSTYEVHLATAMCDGNLQEALELAVGAPAFTDATKEPTPETRRELRDVAFTRAELDATSRLELKRHDQISQAPLTTLAAAVAHLVVGWLEANRDRLHKHATVEVAHALDIVSWDAFLVAGKIHRALDGQGRSAKGEAYDGDPVQNDWNGSAKVALISITRSASAWDVIAAATGDAEAAHLAAEMRALGGEVQRAFPRAWDFVRPGFDSDP